MMTRRVSRPLGVQARLRQNGALLLSCPGGE